MDENRNGQQYGGTAQPYQNNASNQGADLEPAISMGEWMWTLLLMYIPCVNIILALVWAFGSNVPKSKQNFFRAYLVWILIGIVASIVIGVAFGAAMVGLLSAAS
ncbi:MAG: hypothetical protein Q4C60_11245 [Eubacteriales bacterium]|nr:hypothetical protein [Eubacteriales bacterium]